ncbi:hypothetical protein FRC02_009393 [Tulasnella sp. 418]|nr:hypothetical protein FRC02_009393 [Tulasnella sp. 418]
MDIWDDDPNDEDYVPSSTNDEDEEDGSGIPITQSPRRVTVREEDEDEDEDDDDDDDETPQPRTGGSATTTLTSLDFLRLLSTEPTLLSFFTDATRTSTTARRTPLSYMDDGDDDSRDDIDDPAGWSKEKGGFKDSKVPNPKGTALLKSGEFGRMGPSKYDPGLTTNLKRDEDNLHNTRPIVGPSLHGMWRALQATTRPVYRDDLTRHLVPNSHGTVVARYDLDANAYSGQFSADSSFYYTCCQDFRLHIYDTTAPPQPRQVIDRSHETTMKVLKTVDGVPGSWTITDSHLSPDNEKLIYSSITSTVYMTKTFDPTNEQIPIQFGSNNRWAGDYFGIYSCRFSTDGREIVAGGNGQLLVYDLGAMKRSIKISAHSEDVNSCCWADENSGNVLVSASDDTTLKVWDRRSLGATHKPSGVLIGHTEGITHVSPRGDGRYVISNGKDQILRLWDLRKMSTPRQWEQIQEDKHGHPGWDYRRGRYPKPRQLSRPEDTSVMNYRGHQVLRTLIRCHFSPQFTTGSSYIVSGSADGKIHIWSLDGRVVQVLDRSKSLPISFDPSAADPAPELSTSRNSRLPSRNSRGYIGSYYDYESPSSIVVRDVAWHGYEPVLMSCAWGSTIARHEWKGLGKNAMTLQDVVERDKANIESKPGPGRVL